MKAWRRLGKPPEAEKGTAAGQLDAARLRFFANIVHELRTPLSVMLDQIDSALLEVDGETRNHQLRVAARNARRLDRLASQAIELTRLDAGSREPLLHNVALVPFVDSLVMSFEDLAERHGLVLEFFARRDSVRGRVDPEMLTTIVSNLMSNAIKFTPAGGRIGVALDFMAPDVMQVSVVDTGVGIAADRHAQLFTPFVRDRDVAKSSIAGAGIGLALSRELARLHGGDITVQSAPGKGSRFEVTIPVGVSIDDPQEEPLAANMARPEITAEILYRSTVHARPEQEADDKPTILLAELNGEFQQWAADSLSAIAGVDVEASHERALQNARDMLPDLVIADDRPDASDGIELLLRLRADERTSHIPVLLISAGADSARRIAAFDAGADDYLDRVIGSRELRAKAASILERYRELRRSFREQVVLRPSEVSERSVDQQFLEKVTATIESSIESAGFSVQDLGNAVAMSTSQLTRKLRALIGQAPAQLIRQMRLQRGADLIMADAGQISDISLRVGFSDQSHFSRAFKRHFGVSPAAYRQHKDKAGE